MMNDIRRKAKDYAKVKHKEEYNDSNYHRDVLETINDFEAGYRKALAISRVVSTYCECEKYPSRYEESNNYCYDCDKPLN